MIMTYKELLYSKDYITYGDLLNTDEWKTKRNEILKIDHFKCTNCKNANIYKDLSIGVLHAFDANRDILLEAINGRDFVDNMESHAYKFLLKDIDSNDAIWKTLITNNSILIENQNALQELKLLISYFKTDTVNLGKPVVINKIYNSISNEIIWQNPKYIEFSLHIHHNFYIRGQLPWEYPKEGFRTLCRYCHHELHFDRKVPVYGKNKILTFCSRCSGEGWLPEFSYHQHGRCFRCDTACYDELIGMNLKVFYEK